MREGDFPTEFNYLDNHPTLIFAEVQQQLESKQLAAEELLQQEYWNMTAQLGVAAAFQLTWAELDQEVQQLSCLLSLFAPVPFDWRLVEQCLPSIDQKDLGKKRDDYLLKLNLLQLTPKSTYRLHPLLREFLKAKLARLPSGILALIRKLLGVKLLTASDCKRAFAKAMTAIRT